MVNATPRPFYPRERDPVPLYRRLGGPQGPSGRVQKILPPPGFDPQSVQPVGSRIYTLCGQNEDMSKVKCGVTDCDYSLGPVTWMMGGGGGCRRGKGEGKGRAVGQQTYLFECLATQ
jgi:hypothetical protein